MKKQNLLQEDFFNYLSSYPPTGRIGVLTVIFNVFAIGKIGASLMTALGLLGQMMTSLLLENNGWLATSIRKLNIGKIIGLAVVCLGIGVMLL